MDAVVVMCPLPWWISGLLNSLDFTNYAEHVLLLMVACVGTCEVPLEYSQASINQPHVCDDSILY